jgi:probable HAF family extracellular repeat protein
MHLAGIRCALSLVFALASATAYATDWTITDLGGGFLPMRINKAGQVMGNSSDSNAFNHAFVLQNGVLTDLGNLGGTSTKALGINDAGQIVGWSFTTNGVRHAFLYSDGTMTDLGTFGGASQSYASGINNAGQIIITEASERKGVFIYDHGVVTSLNGSPVDLANAINDAGQVVGGTADPGQGWLSFSAWLESAGTYSQLGDGSGGQRQATGINNSGQVLGYVTVPNPGGSNHAVVLFGTGSQTYLTPLDRSSEPRAINDPGQVVGYSSGDIGGFLYENGSLTRLMDLPEVVAAGWQDLSPSDINNLGQIVGTGLINGEARAFLLSPARIRFEENDVTSYSGPWAHYGPETGTFSGGAISATNVAQSTTTLCFTGTAVSWIGVKCNVCGIAAVSIDGGAPLTVDTAGPGAPGSLVSESVFSASGLTPGVSHTILITVTGTTNSGDAYVAVDAFDVTR